MKLPRFTDVYAAAVLFLLVAGGAAAAIYFSEQRLDAARRELALRQTALRDARLRLQRSGEEEGVIVRYLGAYRALEAGGLVGPEKRVHWVDALRTAAGAVGVSGVEYQLGAQQPYGLEGLPTMPSLRLRRSPMTLNLKLLHEGQLMPFMDALAAQRVGFFVLDRCALERLPGSGSPPRGPNLRAECGVSWLTLQPEPEKK